MAESFVTIHPGTNLHEEDVWQALADLSRSLRWVILTRRVCCCTIQTVLA